MSDAIVEEIRKIRDDYARRFNYDLHAMCADLRHEQELSGAAIVSIPRRPAQFSAPKRGDEAERAATNRR
jgi:hypothetical protein